MINTYIKLTSNLEVQAVLLDEKIDLINEKLNAYEFSSTIPTDLKSFICLSRTIVSVRSIIGNLDSLVNSLDRLKLLNVDEASPDSNLNTFNYKLLDLIVSFGLLLGEILSLLPTDFEEKEK